MIYRKLMQAAGGAGGGRFPLEFESFSQSTTLEISYPTNITAGNLLVFVSCSSGSNRVNEGQPAGFTQLFASSSGTNSGYVGWAIATGAESGTVDGRYSNDSIYQYMLNFSGSVSSLVGSSDGALTASANPVDTSAYGSPSLMFNIELNDLGAGSVGFVSGTDGTVTGLTNLAVGFTGFPTTPGSVEALSDLGATSNARSMFAALHSIV